MSDIDRICYGCVRDLEAPGIVCPHCGWDNKVRRDEWGRLPAMKLKNNKNDKTYFIGRPLGAGGFGVTYLGRDMTAGSYEDPRRAIKEFFPMGMAIRKSDGITVSAASAELVGAFKKRKDRSKNEGDRLQKVGKEGNVSNVVRAHDLVEANNTTYIVMDYIDGDTLTQIVRQDGPFTWKDAMTRLKPVLVALEKMHREHKIYHMDISPDNIMLRRREGGYGEPVILDFGASIEYRDAAATQSKSSMTVRDGYTPPEQYDANTSKGEGRPLEVERMDEYAICATLYFVISGEAPAGSMARLTGTKLKPLSWFDNTIPEYFENAIYRGMSLEAKDRFPDLAALIPALESAPPEPIPWGRFLAVAVIMSVCALTAVLILRKPDSRVITLDDSGRLTWNRDQGIESGMLVGQSEERRIRYVLTDGESLAITAQMLADYSWSLEELQTNGETRVRTLEPGAASEVKG